METRPGVTSAGLDFEVCRTTVPQGFPLPPCVPAYTYALDPRIDVTGEPSGKAASAFQPTTFPVRFTVREGACSREDSYNWYVDDQQVIPRVDQPCVFVLDFAKEGTYRVRVEQLPPGTTGQVSGGVYVDDVVVQDFLIASLGDSAASGEGNRPFTDGSLASICHRSKTAFGLQAAREIEDADPRSSVTFVHLACTGARLAGAALPDRDIVYQLKRLEALVGDREIDALQVSIGINDLEFAGFIVGCALHTRCEDAREYRDVSLGNAFDEIRDYLRNRPRTPTYDQALSALRGRLPDLFKRLDQEIRKRFPDLPSSRVYLVGYPDPLLDERGRPCDPLIRGFPAPAAFRESGEGEVSWAERQFVQGLRADLANAASRRGWSYVDMGAAGFETHGYCSADSWFVGARKALGKFNPTGIFHPNAAGHHAMADVLEQRLETDLLPGGTPRAPA